MNLKELVQYKTLKSEYGSSIDFEKMEIYFNLFIELYKIGFGKHFIYFKRPIFIDLGTSSFYAPIAFSLAFKTIMKNDEFSSFIVQEEHPFYYIAIDKNEDNLKFAINLSKKEYLNRTEEEIWNIIDGCDYQYFDDNFSFHNTTSFTTTRDIKTWGQVSEVINNYINFGYSKTNDPECPFKREIYGELSFDTFHQMLYHASEDLKKKQEFTFIINLNNNYFEQNLSNKEIVSFINTLLIGQKTNKIY